MRIGIIGAGRMGTTLARLLVDAGHDVAVANSRGPETLRELESELGDQGYATGTTEAANFGDVAVVAVPFGHYRDPPAEPLAGKVVIDASNYDPDRDGPIPELDHGRLTSSELLQRHLAGSAVIKAFNAMRFDHLREFGHKGGANHRYGIPVAGDDPPAKRVVFDLIEQIGYEPVDVGSLADSGRASPAPTSTQPTCGPPTCANGSGSRRDGPVAGRQLGALPAERRQVGPEHRLEQPGILDAGRADHLAPRDAGQRRRHHVARRHPRQG